MEVRTLSDILAMLDANTFVDTLTERLGEVKVKTFGNIFSKVVADALVKTLSK